MKQNPAEHKSRVAIMVAVLMKYNCSVTSQPCSLPPATIVPIFHCKCNLVKLAHYSKLQSLCAPERRSDTLLGGDGGRLYGSSISPPVIKYFSSPRGAPQLHSYTAPPLKYPSNVQYWCRGISDLPGPWYTRTRFGRCRCGGSIPPWIMSPPQSRPFPPPPDRCVYIYIYTRTSSRSL